MPAAQPPTRTVAISTNFQPEAFGRYYLVDKVAIGGMAEVFKAKTFSEAGFEKLLVIKRILGHLSGNDEFVDMFIDEAKISVELHHPNIVQIYDFGRIHDNYFIAMECVEGKDVKAILRKLAQRRKLLPTEYAVYIAHEIAKGLDYAHRKNNLQGDHLGIIHRDVSPSNILVSYTGDVKIADFGIAKAEISLYNTKDGVLKGKFEYMSPEQASGGDVTPQSDIFAAGIILHEMLTGRRLFKTDSEIKTLERIKAGDYNPPSAINPAVPRRLDDLVMRALSHDPARRYATAKEFQAALLEYMYPATPDVTRESLSYFVQELFADDIADERRRMEEGTALATRMWEAGPDLDLQEEWELGSGSSHTLHTQPARWPLVLMGVTIVLLTVIALAIAFIRPEPEVVEVSRLVEAPKPTHGSIHLLIDPEVDTRVHLGETDLGEAKGVLVFNEVPPGEDIALRVEADGYQPYEEDVNIDAGERLRLTVRLDPVPVERPQEVAVQPVRDEPPPPTVPDRQPVASPGTAIFATEPAGASVFVDGSLVGRTPVRWSGGAAGSDYRVEYRLDGYDSASFGMTFPGDGQRESFGRTLRQKAAAPGKVTVNVRSGWANVFIDGKKVDTTPLVNHALSAGAHRVRVVNETTGVDETRDVTVVSGETAKVLF